MALAADERERLIEQYESGPGRLRAAVAAVPEEAMQWRPSEGEFSVHEVVCHCADSETNAAARIRYITAEKEPMIQGYDQDKWPSVHDYHRHPLEAALATVEAVRANTTPLLCRLREEAWDRAGRHSEISEPYTGHQWLQTYAPHVDEHVEQIGRVVEATGLRGSSASRSRRRQGAAGRSTGRCGRPGSGRRSRCRGASPASRRRA